MFNIVWVVWKQYRWDDVIDSIWTTREGAESRAQLIGDKEGRDTFVEGFPILGEDV